MASKPIISGIQQIGIGNLDVYATWKWYRQNLGMDIPVFDEAATAELMLPYTGGTPKARHAILALNMNGGGGAEIWQHTTRKGQRADFEVQIGDIGISVAKFKSKDIRHSHAVLSARNEVSDIVKDPKGRDHFYLKDQDGNIIELIEADTWFGSTKSHSGGVFGAVIGVRDMADSMAFYQDILGFDKVISDSKDAFDDYIFLDADRRMIRRVVLTHSAPRKGGFSKLFGPSEIELVQELDRKPKVIYEGRMWGDPGFIHLCFDIAGMNEMRTKCKEYGCGFTVDSGDFDMGEAAGQFAYIEDPDGTLIEFVETHKVPILKKMGWYINMKKRDPNKPLPSFMLKAMGMNRVKD